MGIRYIEKEKTFHLQGGSTSYLIQVTDYGHLAHLYWGPKIRGSNLQHLLRFKDRAFSPVYEQSGRQYSLDHLPQEYPAFGNSDLRSPAFEVQLSNGSTVMDLLYADHQIIKGKPPLQGLPSTYVEDETEANTLEIKLLDALTGLTAVLSYTAYEQLNVITRSVRFTNEGSQDLKLLRALSMSLDFHDADFDMLHLSGAWARERHVQRRPLFPGGQSVESRRGASSHQHNPFLALLRKKADETSGDVYGLNLVYSGNFIAKVEVDQYQTSRVSLGINPFDFTWLLKPGETFQTPEAVMVYSSEGLGGMSRTYHKLYRTRLCRGKFRDRARPVLVNNWEATYFDFNADKIEAIAKAGQELGIELFVLDDGWFGKRDDDSSSLGDWVVDLNKLPAGLDDLASRVTNLGMQFGLWFEPEMVSPDSDLYRKHPDWCLHVPDRQRSLGRGQLILDLSRDEVCDAIVTMVSDILSSAPIHYVKWDMNRHMTEIGSAVLPAERQRETAHRYMLGLYRVLEEITARFPHVLFESCSGGGGRYDPGMLYYMPQTWTSDNTDAVSRLRIQYGTSIVYPICTMGAHVSAVPNHQTHRRTSLDMRGDAAMSGNFGYELDLTKLTAEERETVKRQVSQYKQNRELVQLGDFYRLLSPFAGDDASWMFVSDCKSEALVFYFSVLTEANRPYKRIKLQGLDPLKEYRLEDTEYSFGGDQLMNIGLNIPELPGDFQSFSWKLREIGK